MTNMFVTMFAKAIKVFSIFDSFVKKASSWIYFSIENFLKLSTIYKSLQWNCSKSRKNIIAMKYESEVNLPLPIVVSVWVFHELPCHL